jgi:hypothetical protein
VPFGASALLGTIEVVLLLAELFRKLIGRAETSHWVVSQV